MKNCCSAFADKSSEQPPDKRPGDTHGATIKFYGRFCNLRNQNILVDYSTLFYSFKIQFFIFLLDNELILRIFLRERNRVGIGMMFKSASQMRRHIHPIDACTRTTRRPEENSHSLLEDEDSSRF